MADSLETIAAKNQQKLAYNQAVLDQKAQAAQALQEIQLAGKQQQVDPTNIFAGLGGNVKANNNPLIGAFDQYLAQEQAQNPFLNTAKNVRQARAPQGSGLMDQLLFSFAQGALSGGLDAYGQEDIGSTLREDLPPQLATIYPERDFSSIFGDEETEINPFLMRAQLIDALGDEESNQALQLAGLKGALTGKGGGLGAARPNITIDKEGNVQVSRPNPTSGALPGVEEVSAAQKVAPSFLDEISKSYLTPEEYFTEHPNTSAASPAEEKLRNVFDLLGEESIPERRSKRGKEALEAGLVDAKSAAGFLRDEFGAQISSAKELAKNNVEASRQATEAEQLLNDATKFAAQAEPLMGPGVGMMAKRLAAENLPDGLLDLNPWSDKSSSGDALDGLQGLRSLKSQIIKTARDKGTGSVSDYEDRTYIASGVNEELTPDSAQEMLKRLEVNTRFKKEKAQFAGYYISNGGDPLAVDRAWDKLNEQFPRYVKDNKGNLDVNPDRPPLADIVSASNKDELFKLAKPKGENKTIQRPNPKDYASGPAFKAAMTEWRAAGGS